MLKFSLICPHCDCDTYKVIYRDYQYNIECAQCGNEVKEIHVFFHAEEEEGD